MSDDMLSRLAHAIAAAAIQRNIDGKPCKKCGGDPLRPTFARHRDGDIEFSAHTCPGLSKCINHPRWSVVKNSFLGWVALPPGWFPKRVLAPKSLRDRITHAEAINYAQKEATK